MTIHTFSVNSRGRGTKTRQRGMTAEQAAAILLVTVVIPSSLYWNSNSRKRIILGSKGSCRTDCQKERPPHDRRDKDTSRGKENVGGNVSNQKDSLNSMDRLATFLPKLRGYGDIPYDQQYRGAIALAKRHFFPKGRAPTKKEV